MSAFETAALDPLFWLHHANIDRLWEVWRLRDPRHTNPTSSLWSTVNYELHDSGGSIVKFVASQVEDTTAAELGYRYEDVSDPFPVVPTEAARQKTFMVEKPIPEMVAATKNSIRVSNAEATASLSINKPTGPAREMLETGLPSKTRVYLNIENVTGKGATTYRVYLNLPANASPRDHEDLLAGNIPTFGVREASRVDEEHAGSGLHFSLDITDLIQRLSGRKDWDPKSLRVTFVPKASDTAADIQVGRISLYYA
jgi:tyrosinase